MGPTTLRNKKLTRAAHMSWKCQRFNTLPRNDLFDLIKTCDVPRFTYQIHSVTTVVNRQACCIFSYFFYCCIIVCVP